MIFMSHDVDSTYQRLWLYNIHSVVVMIMAANWWEPVLGQELNVKQQALWASAD